MFDWKQLFTKPATLLAAAGLVCLLVLGIVLTREKEASPPHSEGQGVDTETFRLQAAEQLEQLLSSVEGVGKVKVMITVESTPQKVYAKDSQTSYEHKDASSSGSGESQTVFSQEEGKEKVPVLLYEQMPQIGGVAVVCQGAKDPRVSLKITQLVCGLFGIGSNRVSVTN